MTANGFSLSAAIDEALAASANVEPAAVARDLAAVIPSRHLRDALRQALPALVSSRAALNRSHAFHDLPPADQSTIDTQATDVGGREPSRWAGVGDLKAERLYTGARWLWLGQATAEDLRAAAAYRRRIASSLTANADRYDRLADLLDARGISRVADLADDDLGEAA